MSLSKVIKTQAKGALKGFQSQAAMVVLLILLLQWGVHLTDVAIFRLFGYDVQMTLLSSPWLRVSFNFLDFTALWMSVAACVVQVILLFPLQVGLVNWYLELTDCRVREIGYLFWPYENRVYFRSIGLRLNLLFKWIVYGILLVGVPAILVLLGLNFLLPTGLRGLPFWTSFLVIWGVVAPFLLLFLVFWQRYSVAHLLLCHKYQMTISQALRASVVAMKGNQWRLLWFKASFLGWILPLFVFGAGWIWVVDLPGMRWLWNLCLLGVVLNAMVVFLVALPRYHMACIMICRYFYEVSLAAQREEMAEATPVEPLPAPSLPPQGDTDNPLNRPIVLSPEDKKGNENKNDSKYYL